MGIKQTRAILLGIFVVACGGTQRAASPTEREWTPDCIAVRGCEPPTPVPPCDAVEGNVLSVDELSRRRAELRGKEVVIQGHLFEPPGPGGCSEKACQSHARCCNRCTTSLMRIRDREDASQDVFLRKTLCESDDSGMCCPVRASGQEVVVRGTLVLGNRSSSDWGGGLPRLFPELSDNAMTLEDQSLCEPRRQRPNQ
jgi:hypothetical protein